MTSWSIDIAGNDRALGGILFADDFDAPEEVRDTAARIVAPTFTAQDTDDARAAGFRAGRAQAAAEHVASDARARTAALAALAASLADARLHAERIADESACALARLVLSMAAAMLPVLCRDHGEAEARAMIRAVLPGLSREPRVTVRAHPATLAALRDETAPMDAELTATLRFVAHDAMPPGDVRVAWAEGAACREADAIWHDIAAVLAPAGLLSARRTHRETQDA